MPRNFQNVAQFRTGSVFTPPPRNPGSPCLIHRPKSTATAEVEFAITSTKSRQAYQPLLQRYPVSFGPTTRGELFREQVLQPSRRSAAEFWV